MLKTYRASCHCGQVAIEADLDLTQPSYRCNCSICRRNRFWPAVATEGHFRVISGESELIRCRLAGRKPSLFLQALRRSGPGIGNDTPMGKINIGCLEESRKELSRIPRTSTACTIAGTQSGSSSTSGRTARQLNISDPMSAVQLSEIPCAWSGTSLRPRIAPRSSPPSRPVWIGLPLGLRQRRGLERLRSAEAEFRLAAAVRARACNSQYGLARCPWLPDSATACWLI
jgi:hypothetical protein